ncbi:MFS sugar transporter [Exiguobacterium sp. KKBO11]|uniref:MFS transporter n=1 Tax=Exiguobacterium sp. KKBO11 TaxID=1805000 RepID=UPI0007D7C6E0|nr:MFS transporter [Exiguobacterium sp. KKBO11]OAI87277.1 MFS sugar transporter [Exiguobacterium sp. KKBO11]
MNRQMYQALIALAISAFAIGTTEFVIVGLLPTVAIDLDITLTKAGTLISGYALALAIGTPILAAILSRVNRKKLLIGLMLIFTVGNAAALFVSSYEAVLMSRIVTAIAHGLFFAFATIVATSVVPTTKQGTAVSIMFTGLTVATVLGVPMGTYIGQHVGWRATFGVVALLGIAGLLAIVRYVPRMTEENVQQTTVKDIVALLKNGPILLGLAMTVFGFGATFVLFTYLSPILTRISGYSDQAITWILLVYGVFVAIGNMIGGKLADRHPVRSLRWVFLAQALVLLMQMLLLPSWIGSLVGIALLGLIAFMMSAGAQTHIVGLADRFVPSAKGMASALNISGFNIGIALGSTLGSLVLANGEYLDTAWVGALMALIATILAVISSRQQTKH